MEPWMTVIRVLRRFGVAEDAGRGIDVGLADGRVVGCEVGAVDRRRAGAARRGMRALLAELTALFGWEAEGEDLVDRLAEQHLIGPAGHLTIAGALLVVLRYVRVVRGRRRCRAAAVCGRSGRCPASRPEAVGAL